MKIAYTFVIADLLHFGHLQLLIAAKQSCDKLICGVLTDEAVMSFKRRPISDYQERKSVVESIRYVDEVIQQRNQDPTENLKEIQSKYPDAEIIFVYGDNWKNVPGADYIKSANVKTIRQHFYEKLSNDNISYKIIETALPDKSVFETFTSEFAIKDFDVFRKSRPHHVVTTKAKTLQTLKPLLKKSYIEKTYVITVKEWLAHKNEILYSIREKFRGNKIVVRSSSLNEDSLANSKAGYYHSELNVNPDDFDAVGRAVDNTIRSYGVSPTENHLDQVLIQRQTTDIHMSGVVFTHDLETSSPYYVINYDISGKTDIVTAGGGGSLAKVFRNTETFKLVQPWRDIIEAVKEIEEIIPEFDLDIEFGVTMSGQIVLFQVRPLAANIDVIKTDVGLVEKNLNLAEECYLNLSKTSAHTNGNTIVFSDMLFWNPAELIGHCPSNLAYSIFEKILMTKAWNLGIQELGYPDLLPHRLLERFLYKPYINANLAFLALIPRMVPEKFHRRLQSYYLSKLKADKSLHDKAEFEIMFTCYNFNLAKELREIEGSEFASKEIEIIHDSLLEFTSGIFRNYRNVYSVLKSKIDRLEHYNDIPLSQLQEKIKLGQGDNLICDMLEKCEVLGTVPFSSAARLAFIADALIRSLVTVGVISKEERDLIMNSFSTVATSLTEEINDVVSGQKPIEDFLGRYGHLRSGTYDIQKDRYDRIDRNNWLYARKISRVVSQIPVELKNRINAFTLNSQLKINYETLYDFAALFISAREYFKFVYTKTVSNVLELLAEAGRSIGISSSDLSYLKLDQLHLLFSEKSHDLLHIISEAKKELSQTSLIDLPPLISSVEDFRIIEYPSSRPNFVTSKSETGEIVVLDKRTDSQAAVDNKIIFIENADPGYHWIFSRKIKGLVTKYGGAASHMAICCAEFNIPAAIGCGEKYDKLSRCRTISLNCVEKIIKGAL